MFFFKKNSEKVAVIQKDWITMLIIAGSPLKASFQDFKSQT